MKLSPNEIAYVAKQYWQGEDLTIAVAIALAESGGDTDIMGRTTTGSAIGNRDHGLWQISNRWHGFNADGTVGRLGRAGASWRDPSTNARLAREIFDAAVKATGDGWQPWSVYKSGSYQFYMPDAEIAVKAPWAPPVDPALIAAIRIAQAQAAWEGLPTQVDQVQSTVASLARELTTTKADLSNEIQGRATSVLSAIESLTDDTEASEDRLADGIDSAIAVLKGEIQKPHSVLLVTQPTDVG